MPSNTSSLLHVGQLIRARATLHQVGTKCACDYICWAPLANGAYILLVPLITAALDGAAPLAGSAEALGEFSHFSAGAVPADIAISAKLPQVTAPFLARLLFSRAPLCARRMVASDHHPS